MAGHLRRASLTAAPATAVRPPVAAVDCQYVACIAQDVGPRPYRAAARSLDVDDPAPIEPESRSARLLALRWCRSVVRTRISSSLPRYTRGPPRLPHPL